MIPVVSFVGNSGSGKTTFIEGVVQELKRLGYRVAVVKHTPCGFDIDQPRKDSWRLTQAGSDVVAISSPDKIAFIEPVGMDLTLTQIEALVRDKVDIVLAEGYKNGDAVKVLVLGAEQDQVQLCREEEPWATVSAHRSSLGMPQFDYDDVIGVVNLLTKQIGEALPLKRLTFHQ